MVTWPKRYSWTDPKGTSRLVRVVQDPEAREREKEPSKVDIQDVNTGKRFTDVLMKSLALIE